MEALWILAFLINVCVHHVAIASDPTELCRVMKSGTQFRCPNTCNDYITCNNQKGEVSSCINPFTYDQNKKTCVQTFSDCDKNYCTGINGKWVANPNNCDGFYYCSKGMAYSGSCEPGFHFDESKQLCTFDTTSGCNVVPNICAFLPDKTKFRDENDCTVYYECSNGKKSKKTCKNTYFDVEKSACVDKALVACTKHPQPSNVCGTDKSPSSGFKTDGATCRGYFYCQNLGIVPDLEPVWGQCPEGTFFNAKKSTCAQPVDAYCIHNRCEGRSDGMILSSRNNCHNYITCKNGFEVEEKTCNGDKFFDEFMQACVPYVVAHPCCDGRK